MLAILNLIETQVHLYYRVFDRCQSILCFPLLISLGSQSRWDVRGLRIHLVGDKLCHDPRSQVLRLLRGLNV